MLVCVRCLFIYIRDMKKYLITTLLILSVAFAKAQNADNSTQAGNEVYTKVDVNAEFKGGIEKLYQYLGNNVKYPESARKANIQGKEFVTFIVKKDGSLSNFMILRGLSPEIDAESLRVFKKSPKWVPAKKDGKIVRQQYTVPIAFTIN